MLVEVDAQAQIVASPKANVPLRADVPAREGYEAVTKHTKSTSACGFTRPTKKPRRSLTTELVAELPSP